MRARIILLLLAIPFAAFGAAPSNGCTTKYFESLNEKAVPVQPYGRLGEAEAKKLEAEGKDYLIEKVCPEENSLTIIRRYEKRDYSVFRYKIEQGKVVSYELTNSEGKVISGNGL